MAEFVLDGAMCQECGEMFEDDAPGFPRTCDACKPRSARRPPFAQIGGKTKTSKRQTPKARRGKKNVAPGSAQR